MAFDGPVTAVAFLKIAIYFQPEKSSCQPGIFPGFRQQSTSLLPVMLLPRSYSLVIQWLLTVLPYTQKIAYLAWFSIFILRLTKKKKGSYLLIIFVPSMHIVFVLCLTQSAE